MADNMQNNSPAKTENLRPNAESEQNSGTTTESIQVSETSIATSQSCRLINTLGRSFCIDAHICSNHEYDDWFAVVERLQRVTAFGETTMFKQLKLAQDTTGELIDFPSPQENVFYLVDAKLIRELGYYWLAELDRHDLIPVYHEGNLPADANEDLRGLHVSLMK